MAAALRDRNRYGPTRAPVIWIEHEPGSSGVDAYRHTARKLAGFPVYADRPTGAKEVRAEPWASQCAAKNVYLVDNRTWDIPGWITEHCQFPLGKFKDRVDSASGAFAKLAKIRPGGSLRTLAIGGVRPHRGWRVVVGTRAQVADLVLEQRRLVITIIDPPPVGAEPPESLVLSFADLDPADLQDTWGEPIPPYDQPAEQLIMTPALGKKLWSFLRRQRNATPEVIVLQDDGDRRALSMAYAICETLHLERSSAIFQVSGEAPRADGLPPNRHVYAVTKRSRTMVL